MERRKTRTKTGKRIRSDKQSNPASKEFRSRVEKAQDSLSRMIAPGKVADIIGSLPGCANLIGSTIDEIMRVALSTLLVRRGYTTAQLHAAAQRGLEEITRSGDATPKQKLVAARKLRRHFIHRAADASTAPEILTRLRDSTESELADELLRLRNELKLVRKREYQEQQSELQIQFSRDEYRRRRSAESSQMRSKTPRLLAEIKILLAYPYQHDAIIAYLKKQRIRSDTAKRLIQEAQEMVVHESQLHPVQIELLAQQRAVAILSTKTDSAEYDIDSILRAVDSLLETSHMRIRDGGDDVSSMQLRARVRDLDSMLPREIDRLVEDLCSDAEERWHWAI